VSASSDSQSGYDFCACDCCLWPNTVKLTISEATFINDGGFGGTQPGLVTFPTEIILDRNPNSLNYSSRLKVQDVADDLSDGGFDFPTTIWGMAPGGAFAEAQSWPGGAPGSRFYDETLAGTPADHAFTVGFNSNQCYWFFTSFAVGSIFRSWISGTTGFTPAFPPIDTGVGAWSCMGGATFGHFSPRITSTNPFRITPFRGAFTWWEPWGVGTETPTATLEIV
jgi:hypothetical protein